MPPHLSFKRARQFQELVAETTAQIRQEYSDFERKVLARMPANQSGHIERAFLFEKLAELRVLVSELGNQFQSHADLVESCTLSLNEGEPNIRSYQEN